MGAKELQNTLQEQHNCTISYDTVWKGKEKALRELYGTWEDSFKLLFRWREVVLEVMPDSVIEFDLVVDDGKLYFSRFFCAFYFLVFFRKRKPRKNTTKQWFPKNMSESAQHQDDNPQATVKS